MDLDDELKIAFTMGDAVYYYVWIPLGSKTLEKISKDS